MKSDNKILKRLFILAIVFGGIISLTVFVKEFLFNGYPSKFVISEKELSSIVQFLEPTADKENPSDMNKPQLIGNAVILNGSIDLKLSENQVAIGVAETFHDVQGFVDPPITIFVIYGVAEISVALKNGMWDVWENTSEEFIIEKTLEKIEKVKEIYTNEVFARGYRLIECFSQVNYCSVLESTIPK